MWVRSIVHCLVCKLICVGNYEEGFGKQRYKNKWNDPNTKPEITAAAQMVSTKAADTETEPGNGSP